MHLHLPSVTQAAPRLAAYLAGSSGRSGCASQPCPPAQPAQSCPLQAWRSSSTCAAQPPQPAVRGAQGEPTRYRQPQCTHHHSPAQQTYPSNTAACAPPHTTPSHPPDNNIRTNNATSHVVRYAPAHPTHLAGVASGKRTNTAAARAVHQVSAQKPTWQAWPAAPAPSAASACTAWPRPRPGSGRTAPGACRCLPPAGAGGPC
jgi:hypothetical protein